MKKSKKFLPTIILILFFLYIVNSPSNINSFKENPSELSTAAYSGISVGTKWTVLINNQQYTSFDITNISSTEVYADVYVSGQFQANLQIGDVYVYSDAGIAVIIGLGTYNDTYGGRMITVCKFSIPNEYLVVDIDTGILVEINSSQYTLILTSWGLYGETAISGYSWMFIIIAIIGPSTYILKKGIPKKKENSQYKKCFFP